MNTEPAEEVQTHSAQSDTSVSTARTLLFLQFYLIAGVGVLHIVGSAFYLYWLFWWYDVVVHALGSMWAALAVNWVYALFGKTPRWAHVLFVVILIGAAWEVFEYVVGISRRPDFAYDTSTDLLVDVLGALAGFFIARRVGNSLT